MSTPETSEMNEIAQLAKTFSTACKKVVEEGQAGTYTTPTIKAASVVLTAGTKATTWPG